MFKLHLIAYPDFFEGEVDLINRLLKDYDIYFHLRKPTATKDEYLSFIAQLNKASYHKVVLHDCYHLAEVGTFAACHFATSKRSLANDFKNSYNKSTSCHSFKEVIGLNTVFNQCFLSPVFNSISKQGYQSPFQLEELVNFLKMDRKVQIIALGGIDVSNIKSIQEMGFNGAAVLGAVWGHKPQRIDDFCQRIELLLKQIG